MRDLVERLRKWGDGNHYPKPVWGDVNWPHLMNESADRVEALEKEVRILQENKESMLRSRRQYYPGIPLGR